MKGFEPARHVTSVSGRDYLEVKWRLVWLRSEHPEAQIETEIHSLQDGVAIFKARVVIPEGGVATGWGSESVTDFADFIEKAETKALGRALAALGYGIQFCADFDEPAPSAGEGERRSDDRASGAQVRAIYAVGRAAGLARDAVDARCHAQFERMPGELSRREASGLIDALKAETGDNREVAPAVDGPGTRARPLPAGAVR